MGLEDREREPTLVAEAFADWPAYQGLLAENRPDPIKSLKDTKEKLAPPKMDPKSLAGTAPGRIRHNLAFYIPGIPVPPIKDLISSAATF